MESAVSGLELSVLVGDTDTSLGLRKELIALTGAAVTVRAMTERATTDNTPAHAASNEHRRPETSEGRPIDQATEESGGHQPSCPACGSSDLYNDQEVSEGRRYDVLPPRPTPWGPQASYGEPRINWTIHEVNDLVCADCEWTVPIDSGEATTVLLGPLQN